MAAKKQPGKQPRKRRRKPLPAGYRLEFSAPVNGRVGRATVTVLDAEGKTRATDQGQLADGAERAKVVKRLADRLGVTAEDLLPLFEQGWGQAWDKARQQQQAAEAGDPAAAPETPCSPGSEYVERDNRIYRRRHTKDAGDILEPLANFTARITGEDVIDDGSGEVRHTFRLEGTLHNGASLPAVIVPSADFPGMGWVCKFWGCRANPAAGLGAKDHLRAAIQELSAGAPRRKIYQHTGWRQIEGRWYYLHAGGGIGAEGLNPGILVLLDGKLGHYRLPAPPDGVALADAIRAVLALLDFGPERIMFPLLGATFRAPLGRADTSLSLTGPTGQGKSELAALAQQHFGPEMTRTNLPANWSSTPNALEAQAFMVKDAPLVVDDFKPGGSKHDIEQWHAKADRVLRAQGNCSARARSRPDGTPRPDKPPRGLIISTGEDTPRGESLQARNVPLLVNKGDIYLTGLTPHQQDAAKGLYAAAMSAYLRWLAADYDAIQERLPEEHAEVRAWALAALTSAHARIPGALADLFLGLRYFLCFAERDDVLTPRDREGLEGRGRAALLDAARQQSSAVSGQDPAPRFLRLLSSAITSGRAHLADREGGEPPGPGTWGWRATDANAFRPTTWVAQGRQVGWVDGEGIYLDPEAAYAETQLLGDAQGERLPLTQTQLYKRLKEAGHLASFEKEKTTKRVMLQGRARYVVHLRMSALCAQKPGEPGEPGG
jgi:hypothetical protein